MRRSARRARVGSAIAVTLRTVRAHHTSTVAIALAIAVASPSPSAGSRSRPAAARRGRLPRPRGPRGPRRLPGGPVLVVTDRRDAFGGYYAEILRAEGLNEFAVADTAGLTAATLARHQVVLLAQTALSGAQAALLSTWVHHGGNLIAMRPDARLARAARPRRRHRRAGRRLRSGRHRRRPGRGDHRRTRCSSTARRTSARRTTRPWWRGCTPTPTPRPRPPPSPCAASGRPAGRPPHSPTTSRAR